MPYRISEECTGCDTCLPYCPTQAITIQDGEYWINPLLCNNCEGYFPEPQCLMICPRAVPLPYQGIKGRTKTIPDRVASPILFPDRKNHPFASSIVIWEACNLLAQRDSLSLDYSETQVAYHKQVNSNQGSITLSIPLTSKDSQTELNLNHLDIRAACLHLIFAAYATGVENPWDHSFTVTDQHLESYLGLDKRKDLSKITRLNLLKTLIEQACLIETTIHWPQQGKVKGFSIQQEPLWHLIKVHHHFQKDELGCNHLVGLTWEIRAGLWSKYFLNRQGCHQREAFYQYSSLPLSLLQSVMSNWQHHEGGVRLLLWLVFKTRMGRKQRITVPTLMRIAYGEQRVLHTNSHPQEHNRLIRVFENDLEMLNHYGIKPIFDPETYPTELQPLWARLEAVPEDGDAALDFWLEDGCSGSRLTAAGPRGKWNLLMHARIQQFELPLDWPQPSRSEPTRTTNPKAKAKNRLGPKSNPPASKLTGAEISQARQSLGISQRELARRTGKSQSWIRDVENERFQLKATDRQLLQEILQLGTCKEA